MFLTIFTPTYNRAKTLKRLYASLILQTETDFIWLIVDDGSTDNTKEVVDSFISEQKIRIKYIYQPNQGKTVAHNTGVINADTELFFDIDSDDYATNDAVSLIRKLWETKGNSEIAGIIALKAYENGNKIGNCFPEGIETGKLLDMYRVYGKHGDTSLVFRTDILKQCLYPVFKGEKRMPDEYIYTLINRERDMIISNDVFTICEYLPDGLSRSGTRSALLSPRGFALDKKLLMSCEPLRIDRFKAMVGYVTYSFIAHEYWNVVKEIGPIKTLISIPFSFAMYLRLRYFCMIQGRKK